ncbi:uncharacterized protein DDB_G0288805-like [Leptopilina heterotoma]|uniref:uncharacterized protein DDB_G0288805-like n=1 Tax=Leptopilina heterotoma TaxID=63436 RepID=UPI001CA821E9|nr:uncharacterized protein DDB_G0288805-like [Leptopilina heterotoma]
MTISRGKSLGNTENRCRQCKKLFCCSNCRLAHEQKNHSPQEIKCPICCSKKLQINGDESHEFICHLVFHHLPLLCRLCGQSFQTCEDLKIVQKCGWWKEENSRRVLKILEDTLSPTTTSELDVNNFIDSCNNNRKSVSRSKERSGSHRFVTLNSPPVLIRNTSTPMISSCLKTNFELRKSNSISLHLKTPRNFSPSLEDTETQQYLDNNEFQKCNSDSVFNSGRYNSQSKSFIQSGSSEYYTCDQQDSRRRLSSLSKVEEFSEPRSRIKKEVKQLKKTVRFSDRFSQEIEMAEYEEFFEAQESLSEISQKFLDDDDKEISVNHVESTFDDSDNRDNRINFEKENKIFLEESSIYTEENRGPSESNSASENISLMIRNVHLNDNNDNRLEGVVNANSLQKKMYSMKNVYLKENVNFFNESNVYSQPNETSDDENKENDHSDSSKGSSKISQQAESSQIVMMVVVNNASRFSRTDLVPLIDSELKKLEESSSMSTVYNSISSQSSSQEEKYSVTNSQLRRKSTTSVNSYFSIASTECFSTQNDSASSNEKENTTYENEESSKSDGILSAMARVVRNALKKLPGGSILQESSESTIEKSNSSLAESTSETLSLSSSTNSPPSSDQSVNNLTSKRPRDAVSHSTIIPNPTLPNEDRSPIAKRQRGWYKYKVRARPPIARMRKIQVTSPKGISSETQRFQQGSLSVGRLNTIIPLPSRAHQCTQTEK